MPHENKLPSPKRPRPEQAPAGNEPARFLRNLTSLPDAGFASTYSPAIAAVFARYAELPDPAAARRALLLALKAALKRRRAFILPRFTQAEDSWRIRECASYAVAVAVLVEHASALLDRTDPPPEPDTWPQILGDPEAAPDSSSGRVSLFHAIVPTQGRRWIAREPLVQALIGNYFTGTAPDELRDIIGPVVATFGRDHQAARFPPDDDPPAHLEPVPNHPPRPSTRHLPGFLMRSFARARATLSRRPKPLDEPGHAGRRGTEVNEGDPANHRSLHDNDPLPDAAPAEPRTGTARLPKPEPRPDTPTTPAPPSASSATPARSAPASKPPRHHRSGPRVADILDGLPTAPPQRDAGIPDPRARVPARRPDIGDHAAGTARIGHASEYARRLAAENGSRATPQSTSFVLPGPVPDAIGQPLDIVALFPAADGAARIDPDAIAAWIHFRDHLVQALRSGAQSANEERSLVHLLDVGAFLVWPQVALPFADQRRIAPAAIKSAMRAARVLAVNRADRQEDRHAFPALTGDPEVTCHGLVTLPEYLWPDTSQRPTEPSTFVRPPGIYGQRYRRPR